ncbi:hypothetical protein JOB18_037486 [Solea senegalensis]|uniref:Uncharacterized protein n=1 Tax=Solea senegalensis TaxID=28829 RepID=A0AAV6ST94_SOLSE|nr:hypothetical protein JOB18_037486 [Solea senegalensis]
MSWSIMFIYLIKAVITTRNPNQVELRKCSGYSEGHVKAASAVTNVSAGGGRRHGISVDHKVNNRDKGPK